MRTKRFASRWVTSLFAGALLAAATSSSSAELTAANIGYYPGTVMSALVFIAESKGYYKKHGIAPTLIPTSSGPIANSNLASGAIDFALQPPTNVGIARDRGLDQVFVAGNLIMPWVVMVKSDVPVPNAGKYPQVMADFKGMAWGPYARGSDSEMFLRVMASDAGLDPDKDVTWIGVGGPSTGLPALKSGKIQVYLALDPAPLLAVSQGYGRVVVDLRKGEGPTNFKGIVYQGVVALRATAEKRPELVSSLVKAHADAYCWVNDPKNFDELAAFLKTKMAVGELSDDQFRELVRDGIKLLTLAMPVSDFNAWNATLLRAKTIKEPLAPSRILWASVPTTNPGCR